jgi:hypothetical protein
MGLSKIQTCKKMYFTYKLSSTELRKLLNWSSFSLVVLDIRESYRLCFAQKEQILKLQKSWIVPVNLRLQKS